MSAETSASSLVVPMGVETADGGTGARRLAWRAWAGGLLSLGLLAALVVQLDRTSAEVLAMALRLSPAVWAAFLLLYLAQPVADFAIFERLWKLPITGLGALLRKYVINEIVLGYSGEAYFYLWARRRLGPQPKTFEAIKDVSILSGLAGNLLTVEMAAICATRLRDLDVARQLGPALWLGLIPAAISLALLVFARRVFSLRPSELVFVAGVHVVRLAIVSGLTILVWTLALPDVALGVWMVLLTVRLLVARIPFLTNKELIFGNVVLLLAGPHSPVGLLLATLALAMLTAHLATIGVLGSQDLLRFVLRR
jgi:hypothetical protein